MYETEIDSAVESIDTLPPEIRTRFAESRGLVEARTTLPWGEHCTECAWPTCYTTCELYVPRVDGGCRQFVDGMVRIDHQDGLNRYILKLRLKSWAKLWAVGNLDLVSLPAADARERRNVTIGRIGRNLPVPSAVRPRLLTKINHLRRRRAERAEASAITPDCFLLECYNPNSRVITLTMTVRGAGGEPARFERLVSAPPGYTRAHVAVEDIARAVSLNMPFEVEIVPNECADTVLYFGALDFVRERAGRRDSALTRPEAKKWKCIVWDLDNTLWDGVLIEDGSSGIRVRPEVATIIRELDQRGILHSIASKNNHDDAMAVLKAAGLSEYFLYPQIGWNPKSASVARIAGLLNIGADAMAFVDDQVFEREEVRAGVPTVALVDPAECPGMLDRWECQVPATRESRRRRVMYQEDVHRSAAEQAHSGNYAAFLRECRLEVRISALAEDNLKRVYEVAQRTNQMNFSGNRYPETRLREMMGDPDLETYVIDCEDRFGAYGIIGFAVADCREPRLLDLMFSCRVQGKRVEHAVLAFLLKRFVSGQGRDFWADFRRTPQNTAAGRVFEEMGFDATGERDGALSLVFRRGRDLLDEGIVAIRAEASTAVGAGQ